MDWYSGDVFAAVAAPAEPEGPLRPNLPRLGSLREPGLLFFLPLDLWLLDEFPLPIEPLRIPRRLIPLALRPSPYNPPPM